ncbi:MAG: MBL fold metallo-hydrolase [Anaerolineales bacterium]|jgi:ribonuclease Z
MPKLVILGTAHAIPDENHDNTHLALIGNERRILIDCSGNSIVQLKRAGIEINSLTDIILTHFHPDHVAGIPSLLTSMWLLGRRDPIAIYGLEYTLNSLKGLMGFYEWDLWPNIFTVNFHPLPEENLTLALQTDEFQIYTSPVKHLNPTVGLRIDVNPTGKTLAYSCDTEPCEAVVELSNQVDMLIHEATGEYHGHSSAAQAGIIAAQAGVGSLYLIHYDPQNEMLVSQAQKGFPGPVIRTEDFMILEL